MNARVGLDMKIHDHPLKLQLAQAEVRQRWAKSEVGRLHVANFGGLEVTASHDLNLSAPPPPRELRQEPKIVHNFGQAVSHKSCMWAKLWWSRMLIGIGMSAVRVGGPHKSQAVGQSVMHKCVFLECLCPQHLRGLLAKGSWIPTQVVQVMLF